MQNNPSAESRTLSEPHAKFGLLLFEQKFPFIAGVAALVFGMIMILVGFACFGMRNGGPKAMIAAICGVGVGICSIGGGIYFLLVKTATSYHFYEDGFVYRYRSKELHVPYLDVVRLSIDQSRIGGKMPGTYFNMHFSLSDGRHITYELGVDDGDAVRMARATKLIQHIRSSIPEKTNAE
jgi:hypothetical protein